MLVEGLVPLRELSVRNSNVIASMGTDNEFSAYLSAASTLLGRAVGETEHTLVFAWPESQQAKLIPVPKVLPTNKPIEGQYTLPPDPHRESRRVYLSDLGRRGKHTRIEQNEHQYHHYSYASSKNDIRTVIGLRTGRIRWRLPSRRAVQNLRTRDCWDTVL